MTVHNEAKKEDIASVVIMPGDPLRAKYIAENFLKNYKLVNQVRGMFAYTGEYEGKRVTVMASGMGMPSMGIYCYELYKFYDVNTIIRVGSCGVYTDKLDLLDTILVNGSYTLGNFANNFANEDVHFVNANKLLNEKIEMVAKNNNINLKKANIACTECFDPYIEDIQSLLEKFPKEKNIVGAEMESFSLLYIAQKLNKEAACLLTVVDSVTDKKSLSAEIRQKTLNNMIKIALDTIILK